MNYSVKKVFVYAGRYPFRELAEDAAKELKNKGFKPLPVLTAPGIYSLKMGAFNTEKEADWMVRVLEEQGLKIYFRKQKDKIPATSVQISGIEGEQRLNGIKSLLKRERIDFYVR